VPVSLAILRDKSAAIIAVSGIIVDNDHTVSDPGTAAVLHLAASTARKTVDRLRLREDV
jgi:hypothetical protein